MIDEGSLPDLDGDIAAIAAMYLKTSGLRSWSARAVKILTEHTKKKGSIPTPDGSLGRVWSGWDYPPSIADEMPQLGRNVYSFSLNCLHDPHRPLEVLLEAMPELASEIRREWSVTTKIDGKLAHEAAEGDGVMGERVRALRERHTSLGRVR